MDFQECNAKSQIQIIYNMPSKRGAEFYCHAFVQGLDYHFQLFTPLHQILLHRGNRIECSPSETEEVN